MVMRFSPLQRKLLRDVSRIKGQALAVSFVMACGIAMIIMARSLIHSLETTRDEYYQDHRFGDVFAELERAPIFHRSRLESIPGVTAVETRVRGRLTLDLPGIAEPTDGVVLSLPDDRPQRLNRLFLRKGRLPERGRRGEAVVSEAFADEHELLPCDSVSVVLRGKEEALSIVGVALSPEFVFEARPGDSLPEARRFGVFWMSESELAPALELDGAFNDVVVDIAPGGDPLRIMDELDRHLEPYGSTGAYGRSDHRSAVRLDDEIAVLRILAFAFPLIFLSLSAFMSSAVLSRLARLQREQIALLKAFGYPAVAIGVHYFGFALIFVAIGTTVGIVGGEWIGASMVGVYERFFRFPSLVFHSEPSSIATAVCMTSLAAVVGVLNPVRQAMALPPAAAMRPAPPMRYRRCLVEQWSWSRYL